MHIPESFSTQAWVNEIANKAAAQSPMSAEESKQITKDFSVTAWFSKMFGTNIAADATETLLS